MQKARELEVAGESLEAEETATGPLDRIVGRLSMSARHIALLAAWIATCGSLFFSEVLNWRPCLLCWYQRILMYPLAVILTVGILRNDRALHWYVLPLSLGGMLTSLYHYLLIKTTLFPPPPCVDGVPCTVDYLDIFGFINIPFMALIAFTIISFMMANHALVARETPPEAPADPAARATPAQLAALAIVALTVGSFVGLGLWMG